MPKNAPVKPDPNAQQALASKAGPVKFGLFQSIPTLDVVLSIRHLAAMLGSGLELEGCIKVLAEQTPNEKLKETYEHVLTDLRSGLPLAASMKVQKKVFSDIITSIIDIGEQGGTLQKNLEFLVEYLRKQYELQRKVKGALIYPLVIIGMTLLEFLGVIYFIFPRLESLFTAFKNIPGTTVFIMNAARFIRTNTIFLGGGIGIFGIGLSQFLKTPAGKRFSDGLALRFPVVKNLTRSSILANLSRTLSILMQSGIPIANAIKIAGDTMGNSYYQDVLNQVYTDVQNGNSFAQALGKHPKLFPIIFVKMIEVGEQTGTLESNLKSLYEFHTEDVEEISNNLTTLIEPILLLFIGVAVGGLAISIVYPIYQLSSSINGSGQ
jgi:type IV pilus assembly protein PilC